MEPTDRSPPVLIVGTDAAALVLALVLAEHGARAALVGSGSANPGPGDPGSAADPGLDTVSLAWPALTILERLGASDVLAAMSPWWSTRTSVGSRETISTYGGDEDAAGLPPAAGIERMELERLLAARLTHRHPGSFLTGHRVDGVVERDGAIRMVGPDGEREDWAPGYVVATEHAGVDVLGLPPLTPTGSPPAEAEQVVVVAEIRADLPLRAQRRLHVDPPWSPGGRVLLRSSSDDRWRVEWQLPPRAESPAADAIDDLLQGVVGPVPFDVLSARQHRARQSIAAAFRSGSVFRVGVAAHSSSVLGADDLSTGIEDADNLGWKLAYRLRGDADDLLLDSYDAERRPAVQAALAAAASAVAAPATDRAGSWLRAVPTLARRAGGHRGRDPLPRSEPTTYRTSPVLQPGGGAPAPELPVRGTDGWSGPLADLRGGPLVVLAIGPAQDEAMALADAVESVIRRDAPGGHGAVDRTLPPYRFVGGAAADASVGLDAAGTALGNLLVVRPDGRIAWKVNGEDAPEEVAAALAEAMLRAVGR